MVFKLISNNNLTGNIINLERLINLIPIIFK